MTGPLLALALLAAQNAAQDAAQNAAFLSPIEQGVMRCTEVADGAARLACYDRTARPLRELRMGTLAVSASPEPQPAPAPSYAEPAEPQRRAAPAAPREPRYAEAPAAPAEPAARPTAPRSSADDLPVNVPVTEVSFGPRGAARLVLANGQVWDQIASDRVELKPSRRDTEAGLTATVRPGALGSRRMTVEPTGKTIRVRPAK